MNYYSDAIEIIVSDRSDWKDMIIHIAKKHPKLVVEAAGKYDWKKEAKRIYLSGDTGSKVEAIKYCRSMTGMGLKEAKEAVEALTS